MRRSTTIHTGIVSQMREANSRRINQYAVQRRLGKGQFGSVYLCLNMHDEQMVTMKVIKRKKKRVNVVRRETLPEDVHECQSGPSTYEMEILKDMVHANVTPLYEIMDDVNSDKIFIVMRYMHQGSLEDRVEECVK